MPLMQAMQLADINDGCAMKLYDRLATCSGSDKLPLIHQIAVMEARKQALYHQVKLDPVIISAELQSLITLQQSLLFSLPHAAVDQPT